MSDLFKYMFDLNPKYPEIIKLHNMMEEAGTPHTFERDFDGWQLCYPIKRPSEECIMDAIQKRGSYGADNDLLEIMGLLTPEEAEEDSVVGYLTAEDVFQRIKKHWESKEKRCYENG